MFVERLAAAGRPKSSRSLAVPLLATALVTSGVTAVVTAPAQAADSTRRYVVIARSESDYAGLKDAAQKSGATVHELNGSTTLAVDATPSAAAKIQTSPLAQAVVPDHVEALIDPEAGPLTKPTQLSRQGAVHVGKPTSAPQDPASGLAGLMWNQSRIRSPQANAVTYGSAAVTVAVADTGLDFTHSELAKKVTGVVDFTSTENPPICKTYAGASDDDWAALYGGPASTDWNGHGSWIGGNIAGALDGVGINGIAPTVNLVALKISQWCGSAYDSEILAAFQYAAKNHIDVVSISFGGYLDRTDPAQDAIYKEYVRTVAQASKAGTLIVAAAGNEHLRVGEGGKVLSHGSLTVPGGDYTDFYGQYETPGGIPGVMDVSSTGNVVAASSASCPAPAAGDLDVACKPSTDAHQATGVGAKDQLAYYSNYGPRIDIAAPGGARKFNVPRADRGGTGGWPYTSEDGFTDFEEFSITSNWSLEIPCFTLDAPTFYPNECYSTIQGTSMATPHVSAVAALVASARPGLRHKPQAIANVLEASARDGVTNYTLALSPTATSPGELTGLSCPTGYCHLGGPRVSNRDAYGSGIVDALAAVR